MLFKTLPEIFLFQIIYRRLYCLHYLAFSRFLGFAELIPTFWSLHWLLFSHFFCMAGSSCYSQHILREVFLHRPISSISHHSHHSWLYLSCFLFIVVFTIRYLTFSWLLLLAEFLSSPVRRASSIKEVIQVGLCLVCRMYLQLPVLRKAQLGPQLLFGE